ncbi:MAG: VOC family protein [Bacteroidota bacterium]
MSQLPLDRTGVILYTVAYKECIEFYQHLLQLPILFQQDQLTCFDFGGAYLMVELDDEYYLEGKSDSRIRTCLRFNVSDVKSMALRLQKAGIDVDYQEHSWGTVAKFRDPDGNLCAFKDSKGFEKQVTRGR